MEIVSLSKKELQTLKKIGSGQEADVFLLKSKRQWNQEIKVFKKLKDYRGQYFSNKLYTINTLIDNRKAIAIPELELPEKVAVLDNVIVGSIQSYIEGKTLQVILKDPNISFAQKKQYFIQIAQILKKMENCRKGRITNFYFNDIHEENFIIDRQNQVHGIDLDSCRILKNQPFGSRYLQKSRCIDDLSLSKKYMTNEYGVYIADENTDIFCLIMILLRYIAQYDMEKVQTNEYYTYLQYLLDNGLNKKLVDFFSKIYEPMDNVNPLDYIDTIPEDFAKTNYRVFAYKYHIHK